MWNFFAGVRCGSLIWSMMARRMPTLVLQVSTTWPRGTDNHDSSAGSLQQIFKSQYSGIPTFQQKFKCHENTVILENLLCYLVIAKKATKRANITETFILETRHDHCLQKITSNYTSGERWLGWLGTDLTSEILRFQPSQNSRIWDYIWPTIVIQNSQQRQLKVASRNVIFIIINTNWGPFNVCISTNAGKM